MKTLDELIRKAARAVFNYPRICGRCRHWQRSWRHDDEWINTFSPDRRGICTLMEIDTSIVNGVLGPATGIYTPLMRGASVATKYTFSCSEWQKD